MRVCPVALLWLTSCNEAGPTLQGDFVLEGPGITGLVLADGSAGCTSDSVRVGLWGPSFATSGTVPALVVPPEPDAGPEEAMWLDFPLQTPLGEAWARLRVAQPLSTLPLGVRDGEHFVLLDTAPGTLSVGTVETARARSEEGVAAASASWTAGRFLLQEPTASGSVATVGEVHFQGDGPAHIAVFDDSWLTEGMVVARPRPDGPELVVDFPVEPSLQGEEARVRFNPLLSRAVVPLDAVPSSADRILDLVPGSLGDDRRGELIAAAREAADTAEHAWLHETLAPLLRGVEPTARGCGTVSDLSPASPLLFRGYVIELVEEEGVCVAQVEPEIVQHRRRFRGVVGPRGVRSDEKTEPAASVNRGDTEG